jgi:hypothetical protein
MKREKVQPNDFATAEEYYNASTSRKGCSNRYSQTLNIKDVYKVSGSNVPYNVFNEVFIELCRTIRGLLAKGHTVQIPYFGYIQFRECNPTRGIDFKKMMENKFTANEEAQTARHRVPSISIVFANKKGAAGHKRLFDARFLPMQYLVAELKNHLYGTNYYVHPYD